VRQFVNTCDLEARTDKLSTPPALARWLRDASLIGTTIDADEADLRRALEVREALREVMAANHSDTSLPPEAVSALNSAAERADLGLELTSNAGWIARPRAGGLDEALGALLAIVVQAAGDGTWQRLKVCANDACRWAFYDHSRARTGRWCSMQLCGNRAKQQAWRARH
jgi:predicted RNA-binding Zn ribbon-like protein